MPCDIEDAKDVLCLVLGAYCAYQGLLLLHEEERKSEAREKRRILTLARNLVNKNDSSSSDEECDTTQRSQLLDYIDNDETELVLAPQASNSMGRAKTFNPRNIQRKKTSAAISGEFVESIVSKFSDTQFKRHFRVSRKTMETLQERFKISNEYKNIFKLGGKTKIPAKYYMMMFLWFVGKRCSYLELSKVFNVELSRSVCIVDTVLQFLNTCSRDYIRFPESPSEKRISAADFQEIAGFPEVIGCLVNTYIDVQVPKDESRPSSYSKESITSTIQAICDSKGRFLDVYVDATHRVYHTWMLQASPINEKLKEICQGRYHIIAEGDYNLREWLLTPYMEPISSNQVLYNEKHRTTLKAGLQSLEQLKKRFQQLANGHSFSTYKVKKMIIACCVLQNICLDENDQFVEPEDPLEIDPRGVCGAVGRLTGLLPDAVTDDPHLRRVGELKRRQITEQLRRA